MGVEDFSATPASNTAINGISVAEGWAPSAVNNAFRQLMAYVKQDIFNARTDVASATTTDLGAVGSNYIRITGTTTITGLGTETAGAWKFVVFGGALTLTHNATSLILPGAANITTAAGDSLIAESEGSGNWRVLFYQKASGLAVVAGTMSTQNANAVAITGGSITGITDLVVADGGTGASTFTDGGVLIGNGTGAVQVTTAGTSGQVLTSNGAGVDPTFQTLSVTTGTLTAGTPLTLNPYAASTVVTQAHGLGAEPIMVDVYIESLSTEANYSVGERVYTAFMDSNAGAAGVSIVKNATNVILITSSGVLQAANRTTGAITTLTNSNWKMVVTPYRLN